MDSQKERLARILLNRLAMGSRAIYECLEKKESAVSLIRRIRDENFLGKSEALKTLLRDWTPEAEAEKCQTQQIRILIPSDPDYPAMLNFLPDPPLVLYLRGSLTETDRHAVAVVGARAASLYGLTQARRFCRDLAAQGMTVISGLARGIDQAAHEGALEIPYGRTVAVLGSGMDRVYPAENADLLNRTAERGAVLSEYALGTPPLSQNFPRRNRIISGLSLGVLVVEAHARSGSLITARMALEQGREVFAVPGPVDRPGFRGNHGLIKEGAWLAEDALDVLRILRGALPGMLPVSSHEPETAEAVPELAVPEKPLPKNLPADAVHLIHLLEQQPSTMDQLLETGQWAPAELAGRLMELEMEGCIRKCRDGTFKPVG